MTPCYDASAANAIAGLLWSTIAVDLAEGILETAITIDTRLTIDTICTALAGIGRKGDTGTGIANLASTTVCTSSTSLKILIQRTVARQAEFVGGTSNSLGSAVGGILDGDAVAEDANSV